MEFIPFNNTIKVEGIYTLNGQRVENVHYYLVDETPNVDTCVSLCASYRSWFYTHMIPEVTADLSLVLVKATIMETQFSPGVEYATGLPLGGGGASPALPNSVTLAIKWLTGLRGRSYRGRTYHLGLQENQVDNNTVKPGNVTNLMTIYGELMALDTDVGPAVMGIASRFENKVARTTGVITPVINLAIDATVDSQRRRLPGRGR